jgi:hypothetical protein
VEEQMVSEFTSELINELKDRTYTMTRGDITIKLAKKFGFCWGVERAVAMAEEARQHFPKEVGTRPGLDVLHPHHPIGKRRAAHVYERAQAYFGLKGHACWSAARSCRGGVRVGLCSGPSRLKE